MAGIRLEIQPWVSELLSNQAGGNLVLEETIEEGATIGDLLKRLKNENQAFGSAVFDTETGKLSGNVMIVLNDRVMEALEGLETGIKDGDVIKLLPVISGG